MTTNTNTDWPRRPLGEVADVVSGYAFKSSDFGEIGIPVIKIKNVRVGYVDLAEADRVDERFLSIPERYHVSGGDVLISLTGSHISQPNSVVGRVARHSAGLPKCLLNQRAGKVIIKDHTASDLAFLFYALSEQETVRAIALKAHGAANQANVSPTQVESVEIPLPPLPVQRRIASILSAYDELIENSQRRIRILESMARDLYREWFVHFRFPGHEKVPLVSLSLGNVPKGWDVKLVKDILTRRPAGMVYREADVQPEGTIPVLDQSTNELLGFHENEHDHYATPTAPMAIFGDHTCKMQLLIEPFSVGPNVVPFSAGQHLPTAYVFYAVNSLVQTQEYKRHWIPLNAKEIIIADHEMAQRFASMIQPMLVSQEILRKSIRNLRRTRDLLLPRLMSGQTELKS
jgi:type I restriction enzyme S subunit